MDRLYTEWGARNFAGTPRRRIALLDRLRRGRRPQSGPEAAADDETWDAPIRDAMEVAYAFGGPKTQTPDDRRAR